LRTFQRRVDNWRRRHGPSREVFFAQVHTAGECIQTDWTNANELEVTIAGKDFPHLLVHSVLPFSNWQWAMPCYSESSLSLRSGLQRALWELGGVPLFSQTDQSSTATHQLKRDESRRGFNTEYVALCEHLGLEPRTIAVAMPNQNGDIEAAQGHLKRRLNNHLILRRSRDFPDVAAYAEFVAMVCRGANALRLLKIAEERALLRTLPPTRFPETEELTARVSSYSAARVKECAYSMPSRLIGSHAHRSSKRGYRPFHLSRRACRQLSTIQEPPAADRLSAHRRLSGSQVGRLRPLHLPGGTLPQAGIPPGV
jgi:hypothetical protein